MKAVAASECASEVTASCLHVNWQSICISICCVWPSLFIPQPLEYLCVYTFLLVGTVHPKINIIAIYLSRFTRGLCFKRKLREKVLWARGKATAQSLAQSRNLLEEYTPWVTSDSCSDPEPQLGDQFFYIWDQKVALFSFPFINLTTAVGSSFTVMFTANCSLRGNVLYLMNLI